MSKKFRGAMCPIQNLRKCIHIDLKLMRSLKGAKGFKVSQFLKCIKFQISWN